MKRSVHCRRPRPPDTEAAETDPCVGLDNIHRDHTRGGAGDLEWPQHRWSRHGLSENLQLLDFDGSAWRGEPSEPPTTMRTA